MKKKRALICLDGPAGSGKSTLAKALSQELGFFHLDSGATYRAFAVVVERLGYDLAKPCREQRDLLYKALEQFNIELAKDSRVILNGEDVTTQIRSEKISQLASVLSQEPVVREKMVACQRALARGKDVVAEGRDMATVVFAEADLKVYLTAREAVRAKRRYEDLCSRGLEADLAQVEAELRARDERDLCRAHSPLKAAEDAVIVDTSDLTVAEALEKIKRLWEEKKQKT